MKLPRRQFLHLAAGAAALPAVSRIARAQAYPTRPVRIDRRLCRRRRDRHHRAPDRSMAVGAARPAIRHREPAGRRQQYRAPRRSCMRPRTAIRSSLVADRRTRSTRRSTTSSISISSATSRRSRASAACPIVMVVNPSVPAKTVPEFIAYAKANPGKINMASAGTGSRVPCGRRAVQDDDRRRHGPRAVSRRRARAHRSARRTGAGLFRVRCRRRSSTSGPASCARWR